MSETQITKRTCRIDNRGFTLVEMMLVLGISTIVLAAMYSVFTIANKNFTTQNAAANGQ